MSYDSDVEIIEDGAPKLYPDLKPPTEDDDVMIIEDMAAPEIVDEGSSEEKHRKLAEKKKEEGNLAYTAKRYRQALELYTQAIELCPQCASYYNNRSACHLMLNQHDKALQEAREAVRLDPKYIKGHLRVAKCQLALGDAAGAEAALSAAAALGADSSAVSAERRHVDTLAGLTRELHKAGVGGDQRRALFCCDRALIVSPGSASLRTRRAECLLALGRLAEAQQSVQDLLRTDAINADALYVRGLCLYRQDDMERAGTHFQQVLRLAPDHQRAKTAYKRAKQLRALKESGNAAFKQGRMEEALRQYGEALLIDPDNAAVNSKLHFNRATVLARQRKLQPALHDCNKAIELSSDYLKAYQRRAKCHMDLEQYEEAVRDYEKVCSMDRSAENRQLLSNAKLELKKSKRKDFYKILGVGRDASDEEIKKAYRKQALVHHPDRHSSATEEVRVLQEHKFKEVGEAYSVLSNRQKRRRYDTGQDLDESCGPDGCHQPDFDPNTVFQAFFGGGAGGAGVPPGAAPGGFRYNMGGPHHHQQQQQQYQFQPGAGPGFQFRFG